MLHTLQHVHVGMWPRVKENAQQEEQEGPVAAALEAGVTRGEWADSKTPGGGKTFWGGPIIPQHTQEHNMQASGLKVKAGLGVPSSSVLL